jgi:glycosyltransferase involved in cell wall biosynthesis
MKILIAAIACSPTMGSEAYVGWSAVRALAERHEVWVIINNSGKEGVQNAHARGEIPESLHFVYHGASQAELDKGFLAKFESNKFLGRIGSWLNYLDWNRSILKVASELHAKIGFDVVHHVTYATWRVGSPLIGLKLPFVWGPISGAENMPLSFLSMLSTESTAFELLRKVSDLVGTFSPAVRRTARFSSHIFVANKETESRIVRLRGHRSGVSRVLQTFFGDESIAKFSADPATKRFAGALRFFAGGALEGRKGVALAIRAFATIHAAGIPFEYVYGGDGPERGYLANLAQRLGLSGYVHFNDGFYGDAYVTRLKESHIYLMPSLRDGAPVTLMQAMLAGCVPIVLDAGGPGEIVTKECGFKIQPLSPRYVIEQMRQIILRVHGDRTILQRLSQAAVKRISKNYSAENYLKAVGEAYVVAALGKPLQSGTSAEVLA